MALDFLAGCVGGCVLKLSKPSLKLSQFSGAAGVIAGYPLDTVKVKIQTQNSSDGRTMYKGTFDCLSQIIKKDGVSI